MKKKKRRFVRGRDWHGWAWKCGDGDGYPRAWVGTFFFWAEPDKPRTKPGTTGQWLRVRFVEADQ